MQSGETRRAWNSTFKARTKPMRRSAKLQCSPLKRTPLKKVSRSQSSRLAKYRPIAQSFLAKHPACEICLARDQGARPSTEVHHSRGRNGALLFDARFFVASCRGCREWPHEHPREARALGILAEPRDWNVVPRVSTLKEG